MFTESGMLLGGDDYFAELFSFSFRQYTMPLVLFVILVFFYYYCIEISLFSKGWRRRRKGW